MKQKRFLRVAHDDDDAADRVVDRGGAASGRGADALRAAVADLAYRPRPLADRRSASGRCSGRCAASRRRGVFDAGGASSAIDPQTFVLDASAGVIAAPCWALPQPGRDVAGIELDVEIGFGADAADVPAPLRQALRMLVAHWYDNRGLAAIGGSVAMLPAGVNALIAGYRVAAL